MLVPLVKSWCTDAGCEVASLGVQVHGGMGFIEETGAAQFYRDARITPIYEGTNGVQAADLVTRKLALDRGEALTALMVEIANDAASEPALASLARSCGAVGHWMLEDATLDDRLAGSVAFQTMCAVTVAGWQLMKQARTSASESGNLARTKQVVARHFIDCLVPETAGLIGQAQGGSALFYELGTAELCH